MDCNTCKDRQKQVQPVPFIVHEADMARMERTNKRSNVLCIILAVLLLTSWGGFIWYESQFETVTETTTQEVWQETDDGDNQFVGGDYNGNPAR